MDLSRFSIDTALFSGADADNAYRSIFFDRLLSGLFENDENLFVKTDIQKDREKIFVFPALYWLTRASKPQEKSKVLYLSFDEETAAAACESAAEMSASFRDKAKPVLLSAENAGSEDVKNADLLFAAVQTFFDLLPSDAIAPRQFGFVIADQAEKTAELPGEVLRKLQGFLLPSWERKTLVIAGKHTPRAKNFAWDFADNPKELKLGETMGYAGTMATISRDIVEADKIRFILHLLADGEVHHLCVFCNLKSAAEELSARLTMNGVAADYIGGNLNPDRKNQIVTKALTWNGVRGPAATGESSPVMEEGAETGETVVEPPKPAAPVSRSRFAADSFVLVLTDEGSKGIDRSEFSIVINHDIPLEPEFYFERLNFLKRQDPQARLYNLVCERYMYGLPAIERLTDASLEVRPLEADIELPEDLSAGKEIPMPETRFRGRDDRHGRGRDSYGEGRSEGRGGMRAPEGDRDHDYRRESPYDQRRPESPDRDRGSDRPSAQAGRDAGRDAGREAAGREAGRDAGRSQAMREGGRPGGREAGRPQAGRREGARRMDSDRRESGATADPYAMSMEERLALYKKKYGKRVEQMAPGAGAGKGEGGRRGGSATAPRSPNASPRGQRDLSRRPEDRGQKERQSPPSTANGAPLGASPATMAGSPRPDQAKPDQVSSSETDKPRGLFGKLQDFFGSHKE